MIITIGVCSTCQKAASVTVPQAGGCRCFCNSCLGAIAGIPGARHCNTGSCG